MVVGNGKSRVEGWHGKAEYFDVNTDSWTVITSYGGEKHSFIHGYASVYSDGYFYIIGGWRLETAQDKIYRRVENIKDN